MKEVTKLHTMIKPFYYRLLFAGLFLLATLPAFSQQQRPLKTLDKMDLVLANRHRLPTMDNSVRLDEQPGPGIAWLKGITFSNGTISFDVKGKDVMQQSFVGIAFHGLNDSTYDAVYFRPFNFRSAEQARKNHSVQYISNPANDWFVLREKFPNKYEQPVNPIPDPNNWFHVRIVVQSPSVKVYVNNSAAPCLEVQQLSTHGTGMLGLWVGNGSGGDWRNLKIEE